MKMKFQYKFYIKDWGLIHREHLYGVFIETVSDGIINFTFDTRKNEISVMGKSIEYISSWDGTGIIYHELPESEVCLKVPYIYIDLENYNGIMVSSSIREIAWELDNMSRRDREYDDDSDEWDEE
ncbi:hypothetical protein EH243_03770 [Amphritea opalescens]|uniref:Uncharacterized protein n=1 Tax=Amphritea opalescens TaxID=2490544 RepID=A0A430KV20_9GAMM|nr:hypothetical protein [Amphritea opalescens]RTE67330.1 hypothetical protein EH243_03770 [Amphritea opalescens]